MLRQLLPLLLALFGLTGLQAQKAFTFTDIAVDTERTDGKTVRLSMDRLRRQLSVAPAQYGGRKSSATLELPLPDGSTLIYRVYDADLLPHHPKLGSYRVVSPYGTGRIAISSTEMSGLIEGPDGYFVITPVDTETALYQVLSYADYMSQTDEGGSGGTCGFNETLLGLDGQPNFGEEDFGAKGTGSLHLEKAGGMPRELRVYDLMMTNTGEFGQQVGGTEAAVLEAFNTAASTVNAILEPQVGISLNLVDAPGLVYLDPLEDPFISAEDGQGLLRQVIDAFEENAILPARYDLGHLLTTRCSGNLLGVVSGLACTEGKTRGVTCVGGSVFNAALRVMAHEIAHQFAVSHTWNNCPNVGGQRAPRTAYEPGAGNSIMSYANSCGNQNVGGEFPYYHVASLEQFYAYTRQGGRGDACATVVETDNITPDVTLDYTDDFAIPISTPFRLEGSATDDNNDQLRYNWEQYDLYVAATDIRSPRETAPLFQSVPPTEEGFVRYFPNLARVVNNIDQFQEVLPDYERRLTFRLTAHDYNEAAGGVDWATVQFDVNESAGPFVVNDPPNTTWPTGSFQEVTWDVAGTDRAPVDTRTVNILLSTDNGRTFDRVLANNVVNSGSASVTVPEGVATGDARILIEAVGNVFFNVNPNRFNIADATEPGYTLQTSTSFEEICLPDVLSIDLTTSSILNFDEAIRIEVDTVTLPAGVLINLTNPRVSPGERTNLTLDFSEVNFTGLLPLTILGITGQTDTARREVLLDIQDNDFDELALLTPTEGEPGIILGAAFDWTETADAERYHIQIATSAAFTEERIYEEELGLEATEYIPENFFEPNTIYFWRVRPENRCGFGPWEATQSFKTVSSDCTTFEYDGGVVTLPNGMVTRTATLFVDRDGIINDLNIPRVDVGFPFISDIKVSVISPGGKQVVLYDKNCRLSTRIFRAGFDDNAPERLQCGSQQTRVVTPLGNLSDFAGDQIQGEWTLQVEVSRGGNGPGTINTWSIELCTDASVEPPTQVRNDTSRVGPLREVTITEDFLEITSVNSDAREVVYTLTDAPATGDLLLYGEVLRPGDTFRQADINGNGLRYREVTGSASFDAFGYVVTTPDGGYLPVDYHVVLVDELLSAERPLGRSGWSVSIFPNPTADNWHARWEADRNHPVAAELFDLNGRPLRQLRAESAVGAITINAGDLPAGVYLLRIGGAVRRLVKR